MKINENNLQEYIGSSFSLSKVDGVSHLDFGDDKIIYNEDYYADIFLGKCAECKKMKTLYRDFTFDTVLVGGLGLGLLPEYLKTQENCSVVDVIEINNELITWTNSEGFLDNTINIIEGDIYSYSTSNKYDLIIIDLWWNENEITDQNKSDLLSNWSDNLNTGGKIILPVAELSLT